MSSDPQEQTRRDPRAEPGVLGGGVAAPPGAVRPALAPWWLRVVANTVDTVAIWGPSYVALLGITWVANAIVGGPGTAASDQGVPGVLELLAAYVVICGLWIWNRAIRQGRTGQSLGKSVAGIRLVSASTGGPVGATAALGRERAHIWDWLISIGFLWPLWDAKGQTFADKISGTVVVRSRARAPATVSETPSA